MTEATVVTHFNFPPKFGSVGPPIPSVQHRIADNGNPPPHPLSPATGEILLKGPSVFLGYLKDPAATAEAVDGEGWLHTGDVGAVDADGYLRITDRWVGLMWGVDAWRIKHLIITAGGKNLSPANIENAVKTADPIVSQVHAHGDKRAFVSAVLTPSRECERGGGVDCCSAGDVGVWGGEGPAVGGGAEEADGRADGESNGEVSGEVGWGRGRGVLQWVELDAGVRS
jgi:long-subunit acyl-CoA synthetase (AMP-forming)